jgi:hypothetical protein
MEHETLRQRSNSYLRKIEELSEAVFSIGSVLIL